jgi:hypothetical protein
MYIVNYLEHDVVRNPVAKALRNPALRQRVVRSVKSYRRRGKHFANYAQ